MNILSLKLGELLESIGHEVVVRLNILISNESISPDSVALMDPHSHKSKLVVLVKIWLGQHEVLNNLGEVSQVELVMELHSSRHELRRVGNGQEHCHCCIDQLQ